METLDLYLDLYLDPGTMFFLIRLSLQLDIPLNDLVTQALELGLAQKNLAN